MNEKTRRSLNAAKASNGSLIHKNDFIMAVKDVFSPKYPLPKSEPAPGNFDNPYVGFVLLQRFMHNPFLVRLQWFGADESLGYVVLSNHMFGNGGNIDHLKDVLAKVHKNEGYFLAGLPDQPGIPSDKKSCPIAEECRRLY